MKVLISDNISQKGIELLEKEVDVDIRTKLSTEQLKQEIDQYHGIIVRSGTEMTEGIIENADNLKAIGRAGTGYDNIDISAATKKGVIVYNTPNANTISAVEHTMGMLLSLARNIPQANESTRQGKWERKKFTGNELYNKVLGIIGLGNIGSLVAKRASAFDMKVIAFDKYVSQKHADKLGVELVSLDELLEKSDFITLHTPLTDETFHLLDTEQFDNMKDGVQIVNCARGENVNTQALAQAIEKGKVAGAALDSHEEEPFDPEENPLTDFEDRVIFTCHLGASTTEAMDRVATNAAEEMLKVLNGELPLSPLNFGEVDPQSITDESVLKLSEGLGKFMSGYTGLSKIDNIEVEFGKKTEDAQDKLTLIYIIKEILDPVLESRVNMVNAQVIAEDRGINIKKSYIDNPDNYKNFIRVKVTCDDEPYSVAGDIDGGPPKLLEVDGYHVDMSLKDKILVIHYKDQPGVIGQVGTILGNNDVNIGSMQVGRDQKGKKAIMLLKTDSKIEQEIMEQIEEIKEIGLRAVKYLEI